jgi:hypothetical protein
MEYLIGLMLSLIVAGFASIVGFDRDRSFYPTVLIVIASYYVLFAVMGASGRTLIIEIFAASVFFLFAVLGFTRNLWWPSLALLAMEFLISSITCSFKTRESRVGGLVSV